MSDFDQYPSEIMKMWKERPTVCIETDGRLSWQCSCGDKMSNIRLKDYILNYGGRAPQCSRCGRTLLMASGSYVFCKWLGNRLAVPFSKTCGFDPDDPYRQNHGGCGRRAWFWERAWGTEYTDARPTNQQYRYAICPQCLEKKRERKRAEEEEWHRREAWLRTKEGCLWAIKEELPETGFGDFQVALDNIATLRLATIDEFLEPLINLYYRAMHRILYDDRPGRQGSWWPIVDRVEAVVTVLCRGSSSAQEHLRRIRKEWSEKYSNYDAQNQDTGAEIRLHKACGGTLAFVDKLIK